MVEVRLFDYQNPTGRCEQCPQFDSTTFPRKCCDDFSRSSNCDEGDRECDSYFTYCLRPFDTTDRDCSTYETVTSTVNTDDGPLDFSQSTVLGLPNPLQLQINDSILLLSMTNVSD